MSQHDMNIANQGFPAFRSDLNNALTALASNSSGDTPPSTTYANQFWYETDTNTLYFRNEDNDAWITLAVFDQTNDEWEIRTAVVQAVDSAGVTIKTDEGTARITVADNGNVTIANDLTLSGSFNSNVSFGDNNITNVGTIDVDSIRGDSDTNTSIDFDGSDVITFNNGGSESGRFDANGRLGIGTESPLGPVHISSSTNRLLTLDVDNASAGFTIESIRREGTELWRWGIEGSGSNLLELRSEESGSSQRLAITQSGDFQFDSGFGSAATAYGCRAWVNFDGTGTVAIREDGNVSSITDNGTGDYTVNFTTAMSDANYSITGIASRTSGQASQRTVGLVEGATYSTTAVRISVEATVDGSQQNSAVISVVVFR